MSCLARGSLYLFTAFSLLFISYSAHSQGKDKDRDSMGRTASYYREALRYLGEQANNERARQLYATMSRADSQHMRDLAEMERLELRIAEGKASDQDREKYEREREKVRAGFADLAERHRTTIQKGTWKPAEIITALRAFEVTEAMDFTLTPKERATVSETRNSLPTTEQTLPNGRRLSLRGLFDKLVQRIAYNLINFARGLNKAQMFTRAVERVKTVLEKLRGTVSVVARTSGKSSLDSFSKGKEKSTLTDLTESKDKDKEHATVDSKDSGRAKADMTADATTRMQQLDNALPCAACVTDILNGADDWDRPSNLTRMETQALRNFHRWSVQADRDTLRESERDLTEAEVRAERREKLWKILFGEREVDGKKEKRMEKEQRRQVCAIDPKTGRPKCPSLFAELCGMPI